MHRIFLSHTHVDKPLVEPVAVRLADIFGKDAVFYDSWSIVPGDGIIEKMNQGLEAPDYLFFFVSKDSLQSGMVKLEWQNALFQATKGNIKIIPVRVDGSDVPKVLTQTLYIDMHTIGLEAAITQIVNVAQGNASFTPQHLGFSNLTYVIEKSGNGKIDITVNASHLMEPNPAFAIILKNPESEVYWECPGVPGFYGGFKEDVQMDNGDVYNLIHMKPLNVTLTPNFPVRLRVSPKGDKPVEFVALLHQKAEQNWTEVPQKSQRGIN